MKKTAAAVMILAGLAGTMCASATLIAGWETWTWQNNGLVSPATLTDGATGSATQDDNWGIGTGGASSDGTFGSLASPAADATVESNEDGFVLDSGSNGYIDFTITATGSDTQLTTFHFDYAPRVREGVGATDWSLEVLSGDITVGAVDNGVAAAWSETANQLNNFDVDLTGLADNDLGAGGTATFRLSFSGNESGFARHAYLDNVGISAIPEPATMGLVVAAAGGLLFVRRRFML